MQQVLDHPVPVQPKWEELLSAVRSGGVEECVSLQERLKPGIRVLLARKCLRDNEDNVMAAVLSSVITSVRRGEVSGPAELARATRQAIAQHVAPRRGPARESWSASPTAALNTHLSDRERDMMRRFYVLAEEPNEICRSMGVTLDEFARVKSLARAAVAVCLEANRRGRGVYA